jgi:hypothetical protein
LQTLDLDFRFGVMVFERTLEARRGGAAGHNWQLGHDLFLGIHQIVELGSI